MTALRCRMGKSAQAPASRWLLALGRCSRAASRYSLRGPKYAPGFTMTELLVGIGIIGGLIGILFPVIVMARQHALQTKCSSNLHQMGLGIELYNQTYRHLPQIPTPKGLSDALGDIKTATRELLICPADESGRVGYALNAAFAGLPKTAGEPSDPLASETAPRHGGRANVLFFDGHVSLQGE